MPEKLSFSSKIPQEQLFAELSREFAKNGWEPKIQGDVFVAEDGKSISAAAVAALVVLGFLLLFAFFIGLLFWIFAAAYVAGADKRKVMVVRSEGSLYEVIYNDGEAKSAFLRVLQKLAEAQKAEPYAEAAEPTPEQIYGKLLSAYTQLYGTSAAMLLERELKKLKGQGLSREEAIKALGRKLGFCAV